MAKIIDGDDLVVSSSLGSLGTDGNIWIDTTARTFQFGVFGSFTSFKEGVTLQALYSKFVKLWETSAYNQFPFPMYAIDAKSGQFEFGFDGSRYSDWGPLADADRQALRDGGWNEYQAGGTPDVAGTSATGDLARRYVGIVSLGNVSASAQLYYQLVDADGGQADFTFTDEVNEAVQIFGDSAVDATSSNVDSQTFFKAFCREQGFTYSASTLADTAQTGTGAYIVNVLLSNATDLNIANTDAEITGAQAATYANIDVSYYTVSQSVNINATEGYDFRIIVDGDNKTLQEIYTKMQYLLRQDTDINSALTNSTGTVTGQTADSLMFFIGPDLYCSRSVFIENLRPQDVNNVYFFDESNTPRQYDYSASLTLNFNSFLTSGGTGYYTVYLTDSITGANDYGTATAIILQDNAGTPADVAGTISAGELTFAIDYDNNAQGGRSDTTDTASGWINITVVAGNKGVAKPVVANGVIKRTKTNSVTLSAEQDRAYID